jgi:hypothetical protein
MTHSSVKQLTYRTSLLDTVYLRSANTRMDKNSGASVRVVRLAPYLLVCRCANGHMRIVVDATFWKRWYTDKSGITPDRKLAQAAFAEISG